MIIRSNKTQIIAQKQRIMLLRFYRLTSTSESRQEASSSRRASRSMLTNRRQGDRDMAAGRGPRASRNKVHMSSPLSDVRERRSPEFALEQIRKRGEGASRVPFALSTVVAVIYCIVSSTRLEGPNLGWTLPVSIDLRAYERYLQLAGNGKAEVKSMEL